MRLDALAAEVVNDERAAVRLQLERRFVKSRGLAPLQVRVVEREFAADDDERALYQNPAAVVVGRRHVVGRGPVVVRVEDADDLAVNLDGEGNPDVAGQARVDALGDGRLARARRACDEERAARVDDAAQGLQKRLRQDEVAEGRAHGLD